MSFSVTTLDERSDAELISAVRAGDVSAYGELFARHVAAARRLARQLVPGPDLDDLVSESFAKVLGVLQRGGGPDFAFRAYLLTAVRRVHVDRIRASARLHTTDDLTPFDPGVPFRDTALEGFESATAARAFASLPERWQLVLWHTEVEAQKPADVARLLGMTPNAVSALAYRAREGLRQAYLTMHAGDAGEDLCRRTRADLGAYVRGGLARRDAGRVEEHLQQCRPCAALYLELTEVNSDLRAVLAPLLLGGAATAYVATSGPVAATGIGVGIGMLVGRVRDLVLAHGPTAAVACAAASAAVVGGLAVTLHPGGPEAGPGAQEPPAVVDVQAVAPRDGPALRPASGAHRPERDRPIAPRQRVPTRVVVVTSSPTTTRPSAAPDDGPTRAPMDGPAAGPAAGPTADATAGPTTAPTPGPTAAPPPTAASTPPAIVDASAHVSVGPGGVGVDLELGVAGVPVIPEMTVRVPLGPAG